MPTTINGYYYVDNTDNKNDLHMGIFLKDYGIEEDVPYYIVEKILYAYISDDTVNVVIPVSIKDFLYQLYWYGYRIAGLDSLANPIYLPDENPFFVEHEIGHAPSITNDEDKAYIENVKAWQTERSKGEHLDKNAYEVGEVIYKDYHPYHTLTMGLAKDGKN